MHSFPSSQSKSECQWRCWSMSSSESICPRCEAWRLKQWRADSWPTLVLVPWNTNDAFWSTTLNKSEGLLRQYLCCRKAILMWYTKYQLWSWSLLVWITLIITYGTNWTECGFNYMHLKPCPHTDCIPVPLHGYTSFIYGSFSEVGSKYVTSNLKNKVQRRKLKSGYLINMIVLLLNLEKDSKEMLLFSYQGLSKYVTAQPRAVEAWTPTFVKNGCYTWITRKRNKSYSL